MFDCLSCLLHDSVHNVAVEHTVRDAQKEADQWNDYVKVCSAIEKCCHHILPAAANIAGRTTVIVKSSKHSHVASSHPETAR